MSRIFLLALALLSLAMALPASLQAAEGEDSDLARRGFAFVMTYCSKCHGKGASEGGGDMDVTDPEALANNGYIDATAPEKSPMWERLSNGSMPPAGEPQPSIADGEIFKRWIAAGAPKPAREKRDFKSVKDTLQAIHNDLQQADPTDRSQYVYFTLTHLYNHPDNSDFDLRVYRAALSKAINSLSWEPDIVVPKPINAEETVLRIDLREVGWDADDWGEILAIYPYGLTYEGVRDQRLAALAKQVKSLAGNRQHGEMVAVRADWFVVNATRPPLYHRLAEIPDTDVELEKRLGVDVTKNFLSNRLARAGFAESGVSTANRLVERHSSRIGRGGYYWKSYDFLEDRVRGNLFQQPLGPQFTGNPHANFAFEHDGGELIFSLPNGLQAYMLVRGKIENDADGKPRNRIDGGPIEVVQDSKRTSGSPVVVNGISCMHCHAKGMIPFRDTVREGLSLFGDAREKVLQLYPARESMDKLVERDAAAFTASLEQAMEPFLLVGEDKNKSIFDFPEPIGFVSNAHHRNLSLTEAAAELGLESAEDLKNKIGNNPELRRLGLAPLGLDHSVDRAFWESRQAVMSPMQQAARVIDFGTPFISLPGS